MRRWRLAGFAPVLLVASLMAGGELAAPSLDGLESPEALAERLLQVAHENRLTADMAARAAGLLGHDDPFVRAMAEWAIAMKVGAENNGQQIAWPRSDPPEWFKTWSGLPPSFLLEADWARQAISLGIHRDGRSLLASVDAMAERASRMAADLRPSAAASSQIAALRAVRAGLAAAADLAAQRKLWLEARRCLRALVMANPAIDFGQMVFIKRFAPHTTRNITRSYPWKHKPGGDICVLSALRPDAPVRGLLQGNLGAGFAWGLDLWWDADRVVFGFARQPRWPPAVNTAHYKTEGDNVFELRKTHEPLHLFEIRLDGTDPRQLTDDPYWNDFEPTYCANGDVVFASDRCGRSAECGTFSYDHANPNLYLLAAQGGKVRQLTDSKDIDRYPHSLDNGLIAYTHWEYQERHFMEVHALWTVRPDGTMSDALFKHHMRAPLGLRDTRSVPGTPKLVAIATGHHTFAYGPVVVVDPRRGMNSDGGIEILTPGVRPQEGAMAGSPVLGGGVRDHGGLYQTPWALSDDCFLASYAYARPKCTAPGGADSNGFALYLIDRYGNKELLARDLLLSCSFPIPLRKRPRPPLPPDGTDGDEKLATCYVTDVYQGMPGVPRGTIKAIRVSQHVGWPFDAKTGQKAYLPGDAYQKQFGFWSWSPVRVIGAVPVEADGSAHFQVPADTALYFQALDERQMEVRRMRSMVSLARGEVRGCVGCHESRPRTPPVGALAPLALLRPPSAPAPPPWGARRLLGYEWLVQPVLDRHCVRCHGAREPKGGLDLSATRAPDGFCQSFRTMFGALPGSAKGRVLVSCSDRFSGAEVTQPKQFGSHRSPLIQVLLADELHRREVKLGESEWLSLVAWVDANAPYYDTFLDKRPPGGGPPRRDVGLELPAPFAARAPD